MPNRLIFEQLTAELATLNSLLSNLAADDVLGRLGLQSRREEIQQELGALRANPETVASIALMFGGRPVLGSRGIEAAFASEVVAKFQDLVTNVWGTAEGADLPARGPVPDREQSQLHITSLLHGSGRFSLARIK